MIQNSKPVVNWTTTDKLLLSGVLPSGPSYVRLRRLLNERGAEVDWPAAVRRAAGWPW